MVVLRVKMAELVNTDLSQLMDNASDRSATLKAYIAQMQALIYEAESIQNSVQSSINERNT